MTDRELLERLYAFLTTKAYITADKESVVDMCQRYKNPPMTLLNRSAMRMTLKEYAALNDLLKQVKEQLEPEHA